MSRAIRRHPQAKRQGKQRAAMPRPQRRPQRETREHRSGLRALYPHWAEEIVSELRKVTWPSREDTQYLTFVVLVVAAFFGVFLGGVDMFFNWLIDNTLLN